MSIAPEELLNEGAENDLQSALQEIRASSRFLEPLTELRDEVVAKLGASSHRVAELKRELTLLGSSSTALSRAQEEFRKSLNGD